MMLAALMVLAAAVFSIALCALLTSRTTTERPNKPPGRGWPTELDPYEARGGSLMSQPKPIEPHMWNHHCERERTRVWVGMGESCNWCGAIETD